MIGRVIRSRRTAPNGCELTALAVVAALITFGAPATASAGGGEIDVVKPPKDIRVCKDGKVWCTDDGGRVDFDEGLDVPNDGPCLFDIDVDLGDGQVRRLSDTEGGITLTHTYAKPGIYAVVAQVSGARDQSNSGVPCDRYVGLTKQFTAEYPEAPKKGDRYKTRGRVIWVDEDTRSFLLHRPIFKTNRATKWVGYDSFKDLAKAESSKGGAFVLVNARFDGKRWVAEKVKEERADDDGVRRGVGL